MRKSAPLVAPVLALVALAAAREADAGPSKAVVVIQDSFGTPRGAVVRGQVVADKGFQVTRPEGVNGRFSTVRKIYYNLQLLRGRPVKNARVRIMVGGKGYRVQADRKGIFSLELGPASQLHFGEYAIGARLDEKIPARILPGRLSIWPAGRVGLSDIDDTVLETDATNVWRTIKHTLTTDVTDMKAVPNAAAVYREAARAGVPIPFLSAGPMTLYPKLRGFFAANDFPRAPVLLQRPGLRALFTDVRAYKRGRIREVADQLPGHTLVLIGDSGQKDPEAYRDAKDASGARVAGIHIYRVTSESPSDPRFTGEHVFDRYDHRLARSIVGRSSQTRGRVKARREPGARR